MLTARIGLHLGGHAGKLNVYSAAGGGEEVRDADEGASWGRGGPIGRNKRNRARACGREASVPMTALTARSAHVGNRSEYAATREKA